MSHCIGPCSVPVISVCVSSCCNSLLQGKTLTFLFYIVDISQINWSRLGALRKWLIGNSVRGIMYEFFICQFIKMSLCISLCVFRHLKRPAKMPGRISTVRLSYWPTFSMNTLSLSTECVWRATLSSWCLSTWNTETSTSSSGMALFFVTIKTCYQTGS